MPRKKGGNSTNPAGNAGPGSPKPSSPARQQVRSGQNNSNSNNNNNSNNSSTPKRHLTETELDDQLRALGLVRKAIPKDGACLFRATSEQLHATQNFHLDLRRACVAFLRDHKEDFEPFVCTDGIGYDHYLYEMSKPDCWAGQAELQALSLQYKVNFLIYSEQPKPTRIDNGFSHEVTLCFLGGNHYDSVYKESTMNAATFAQELIYEMVSRAMGEKVLTPKPSEPYAYKNVGLVCYLQNLREQRAKDKKIAEDLQTTPHTDLSGFYKKEGEAFDQQGWEKKVSRRSKKEKNKGVKLDLDFSLTPEEVKERKQLKEAMEKIAQLEKQDLAERQLLTDQELFPALAPKTTPQATITATPTQPTPTQSTTPTTTTTTSTIATPSEEKDEKKGVVWGGQTNWKNLFAPPPTTPTPVPAVTPKKSSRRAKKAKAAADKVLQQQQTQTKDVITGLVNVDDRAATTSITFGSLTPSSPISSRLSSPPETTPKTQVNTAASIEASTSSTTPSSVSSSTSSSSPSPSTPSTVSSSAPSISTSSTSTATPISTSNDLDTAQKIGHLEAISIFVPEELRNVSIVFGDFPPQSMDDIQSTQLVSFCLPKTKRKEDEGEEIDKKKVEEEQHETTENREVDSKEDHSHSNGLANHETPSDDPSSSGEVTQQVTSSKHHPNPSKPSSNQKHQSHQPHLHQLPHHNPYYNGNGHHPYLNGGDSQGAVGGRPGGYELPPQGYPPPPFYYPHPSYPPPHHLVGYPPQFYGQAPPSQQPQSQTSSQPQSQSPQTSSSPQPPDFHSVDSTSPSPPPAAAHMYYPLPPHAMYYHPHPHAHPHHPHAHPHAHPHHAHPHPHAHPVYYPSPHPHGSFIDSSDPSIVWRPHYVRPPLQQHPSHQQLPPPTTMTTPTVEGTVVTAATNGTRKE